MIWRAVANILGAAIGVAIVATLVAGLWLLKGWARMVPAEFWAGMFPGIGAFTGYILWYKRRHKLRWWDSGIAEANPLSAGQQRVVRLVVWVGAPGFFLYLLVQGALRGDYDPFTALFAAGIGFGILFVPTLLWIIFRAFGEPLFTADQGDKSQTLQASDDWRRRS